MFRANDIIHKQKVGISGDKCSTEHSKTVLNSFVIWTSGAMLDNQVLGRHVFEGDIDIGGI